MTMMVVVVVVASYLPAPGNPTSIFLKIKLLYKCFSTIPAFLLDSHPRGFSASCKGPGLLSPIGSRKVAQVAEVSPNVAFQPIFPAPREAPGSDGLQESWP